MNEGAGERESGGEGVRGMKDGFEREIYMRWNSEKKSIPNLIKWCVIVCVNGCVETLESTCIKHPNLFISAYSDDLIAWFIDNHIYDP